MTQTLPTSAVATFEALPTRRRYYVVALGCALAAVGYLMRVPISQVGPQIQSALAIDKYQFGLAMGAFSLAYGLFEIPFGYLGDTAGPRRTLMIVVLGFTAMTFATGMAGTFAGLLAARFLFGMFQAGIFPNIARMLAAWMPMTQRASAQGLIWMCTRIGGAASPVLVTQFVDWAGDWRRAVMLLTLPGVAWCAIFWTWFRNDPSQVASVNAAEADLIRRGRPLDEHAHRQIPWGTLLRSPNLWAICLAYGCGGFSSFFNISMLPTYLQDHLGASEHQSAFILATALSLGAAACFISGQVSDRIIRRTGARKWGRRLLALIGFVPAGVLFMVFGFVDDIWVAAPLVCGLVMFYDLTMPVSWAVASDVGERYAGTVSGMMNMCGNLGAALGNLTAGYFMHHDKTLLLFIIFAGFYFAAAALWMMIDSTKSAIENPSPA